MAEPIDTEREARIRAKLFHARALARDLHRETLHGPTPLATTMALADAVTLLDHELDAERLARQTAERERDEARAMAPRWVLHRYDDTSAAWRLHIGNVIVDKSGIGVWGAESRIADIETADYHPALESAARAVCARLGLPYIEVPRE